MAVNLAEKYASKLDQVFTAGSYTDAYVNKKYDFDGVKTINVYTATTVAPTNYLAQGTGDRYANAAGNVELQDVVTPYTLTNDKSFKIVIDRFNAEGSMNAKRAGEVLKAEMDEQVIPMIDADRIAAVSAGATAASNVVTATANAYDDFCAMSVFLDEAKAPQSGRVCWVTPAAYNAIKSQITTTVNASEYNGKLLGKGFVGELDGCAVVKVPTSYFPSGDSMVMAHKDAILGAKKITSTRVITDSELVDGSILVGRFVFGSFVLNGKKEAVAARH